MFQDSLEAVRERWTLNDVVAANDLLDAMADARAADAVEIEAEYRAARTR